MAATRTISCNLGENVTGIGYQFFNASGLLGSRVTASISNPRTGVYYKTSVTPDSGAIGVYFDNTAGDIFASEVFEDNPVPANVTELLGTAWLTPGTAGTPDVNMRYVSSDEAAATNLERWFDGTVGFATSGSNLSLGNLACSGSLTVTGVTNFVELVTMYQGLNITNTTSGNGLTISGDDTGYGVLISAGATGRGVYIAGGSTSGEGVFIETVSGAGLSINSLVVSGTTTFTGAITGTNASNNLRINGVAPGASGGLLISGSNTGTTTFGALTVTGATTLTGAVSLGSTLGVTGATTFTGDIALSGSLTVAGDTSFQDLSFTTLTADNTSSITLNILDQGTAQSATSTTVVLRAASAFGDDTLIGCDIAVYGSTQGYWQIRKITDSVLSTDTVTVAAWAVTPTGTLTYKIFGSTASSGGGSSITVADIWDAAAASYNTAGSLGQKLNAAGGAADPLLNAVPGAYAAGTAGYALGSIDDIQAKTDLITTGDVTVTAPVNAAGSEITLYQGDDYLNSNSRAITFSSITGIPTLVGATVVLKIGSVLTITGTVISSTSCRFDVTRTQTAALVAGRKRFEVQATLADTTLVTAVEGIVVVKKQI